MKNKKATALTGLLAAIMALGVISCATDKDERSAGRSLDDERISDRIRDGLEEEPAYKFKTVEVTTYAGQVQLSGFVNTEGQKDRAEQIATRTPGVVSVHNNLILKPLAETPTGRTNDPSGSRIYSSPPAREPASSQPPSEEPK